MTSAAIEAPAMSADEAERLTGMISYRIDSITENYEVVMSLMRDALSRNAHEALGYASPGAYVADRFGQSLQTLSVALRREFVHELSDAGLSTRAIAPVFGVSQKTIVKDTQVIPQVSPEPAETLANLPDTFEYDGMTVTSTGEVIDPPAEPVTTEHTVTEKVKTVTGLDGKEYKRPEQAAPRRRSLNDDAHKANTDLFLVIERIRSITSDDRFNRNKADILAALQPSVDLALEILADLTTTTR